MKNQTLVRLLFAVIFVTSCQTQPEAPATPPPLSSNQVLNNSIKNEKKRQAELDLPFRGFPPSDRTLDTIAFGSCADQDQPQPIWASIEKSEPQLMIMLGDNVYASSPNQKPISEQYNKMKIIPEYRSIREKVPFMAVWDDHDFGQNDGGETNPEREEARQQFLKNWPYVKFIAPEKDGAIYHSKMFGEKRTSLQVIMLDTRSNRSDLKRNEQTEEERQVQPKPFLPHDTDDKHILSEAQWQWLENEFKKPAAFRIVGTSIQLLANDHHFEKWGNFPNERERMFKLLKKYKIKNVLFISGDRHMAAIAKKDIAGLGTIYEATSSGINKPARPGNNMSDQSYLTEGYGLVNFGLIQINWADRTAKVEIRNLTNDPVQTTEIKF